VAKNIKAIKCPNCGSIKKTEIKADYFRCLNCDTEYFLDNDDINININHTPYHDFSGATVAKKNTQRVVIFAVVAVLILFIVANAVIGSFSNNTTIPAYKPDDKYEYYSGEIVYQNSATGKAVFMRIGRENIVGENNNVDYINVHAVFIDPVTKKQIKDQLIFERKRRLDDHQSLFETFQDGTIYMTYADEKLFTLDRKSNKLIDVTKSLFNSHPELSAGLATISLRSDYFDLLTNDGNKYFFIPKIDVLTEDFNERDNAVYKTYPASWFQFDDADRLKKITAEAGKTKTNINLVPNRKFFDPEILYQDDVSLIIATGATAKPEGPVMLQSLNANTGEILWTQPSITFNYESAAKCMEGFAIEYASDDDHDYVSGVLVISPAGKVVSDYQIKRGE